MARLTKARGIRGEMLAIGFGQDTARFEALGEVWLRRPDQQVEGPRKVLGVAPYREGWIFQFEGIADRTEAERWAGSEVCVPPEQRPAPEFGEVYLADLLGCEVIERSSGAVLGRVSAWQEYGGVPLLVVGETEIPFARSIVVEMDLEGKRLMVDLPEGLKDLNAR